MAPSCALDEAGLRSQHERHRQTDEGARMVERRSRRLVVDFNEHVDPRLVEELLVVERECCPFFELGWEADLRRLTVSISQLEAEPALDAIAFALGLSRAVLPPASP